MSIEDRLKAMIILKDKVGGRMANDIYVDFSNRYPYETPERNKEFHQMCESKTSRIKFYDKMEQDFLQYAKEYEQ